MENTNFIKMKEMDMRMYCAANKAMNNGRYFYSDLVERGADRYNDKALEGKFRWLTSHTAIPGIEDGIINLDRNTEDFIYMRRSINLIK